MRNILPFPHIGDLSTVRLEFPEIGLADHVTFALSAAIDQDLTARKAEIRYLSMQSLLLAVYLLSFEIQDS